MKRRGFLLGLLAAPAAQILPKLAIAAPAVEAPLTATMVLAMQEAYLAAAERIINPPFIVTSMELAERPHLRPGAVIVSMDSDLWIVRRP